MKIKISQVEFVKSLITCQKIIKGNLQLPILSNVLMKLDKNKLVLRSTNLNAGVVIANEVEFIKKDNEFSEGMIVVGQLLEYLQTLKSEDLDMEFKKDKLLIKQMGSKASFPLIDSKDYPAFKIEKSKNPTILESSVLEKALSQAFLAVASDDSRPLLTGLFLGRSGESGVIVGTDGYRLSLCEVEKMVFEKNMVVPAHLLISLLKDLKGDIEMGFDKDQNQLWAEGGNIELGIRLLQGDFPDYKKILPSQQSLRLTCSREELLFAVRQMAVFARQSANVVRWQIGGQKLKLYTHGSSSGEGEVELGIKKEGEDLDIAFNFRYLLEYLSNVGGDEIEIDFNGQLSPVKFMVVGDNSFLHIIMPVKMD